MRATAERNDARIAEIEHIGKNTELIKDGGKSDKIRLGSHVTLEGVGGKEFQVVGTMEADPLNGQRSDESPVATPSWARKVGDDVEIKTPAETASYKVAKIS